MHEVDWRGFRVPWVYTVDDDLFVRPQPPPSPDDLNWETKVYTDRWGEPVELEAPVTLPFDDKAAAALVHWDQRNWDIVSRARLSPLFETPVVHFFVRAYLSDDIDEVLAHLTAIEAALGLREDYDRSLRPKSDSHGKLGATRRVAARVAALLDGSGFAAQYEQLFNLRSTFLHGRTMGAISTVERVAARRLSRQVVSGLVGEATGPVAVSRETRLRALLDRGAPLI